MNWCLEGMPRMPSSWGKKNDMPGYDSFRTGLTYRDVWEMLRDDSESSASWRHKRRGTILGMWHELKLQLYFRAVDLGMGS